MTIEDAVADAILAMSQTNLSAAAIAATVGCDEADVEAVLAEPDPIDVDLMGPRDWSDPTRCPFCGASLPDGGAGFVAHIDASAACDVAFARWRAAIAEDIGGEWSG